MCVCVCVCVCAWVCVDMHGLCRVCVCAWAVPCGCMCMGCAVWVTFFSRIHIKIFWVGDLSEIDFDEAEESLSLPVDHISLTSYLPAPIACNTTHIKTHLQMCYGTQQAEGGEDWVVDCWVVPLYEHKNLCVNED